MTTHYETEFTIDGRTWTPMACLSPDRGRPGGKLLVVDKFLSEEEAMTSGIHRRRAMVEQMGARFRTVRVASDGTREVIV